MTVSELMEELKKHPPYMPVVFACLEPDCDAGNGFSSIETIKQAPTYSNGTPILILDGPGVLV